MRWFDVAMPGWSSIPGVRNFMSDVTDRFSGQGKYDPSSKAEEYLKNIPDIAHQTYDPYIERGNKAYESFSPILEQMTQDPTEFLNKMMGKYEQSAGYQQQLKDALRAASNTAAAGGMRGDLADVSNQAGIAGRISAEDQQNWLRNVMGLQSQGLAGQQGLYDRGYSASTGLGGDLMNLEGTRAGMQYQGQAQRNQMFQDLLKQLIEGGSKAAGMMMK